MLICNIRFFCNLYSCQNTSAQFSTSSTFYDYSVLLIVKHVMINMSYLYWTVLYIYVYISSLRISQCIYFINFYVNIFLIDFHEFLINMSHFVHSSTSYVPKYLDWAFIILRYTQTYLCNEYLTYKIICSVESTLLVSLSFASSIN